MSYIQKIYCHSHVYLLSYFVLNNFSLDSFKYGRSRLESERVLTHSTWKKTDGALQITWFSGELLEMLFCMKNMWEYISSNTNDNLHWLSKLCLYSHPFVQQQLLRFSYKKKLKKHSIRIFGACGSIHRNLLFYSSVSSRLIFVLLFRALSVCIFNW